MRSERLWLTLLACAFLIAARGSWAGECDPGDPNLLLPDLIAENPGNVRVLQELGHILVVFTTTVGNVGDGPLIVQGQTVQTSAGQKTQATQIVWRRDGTSCTHVAGFFEFHPSHHHFHIDDFASYQLRKTDPFTGPIVAESAKVSFCLLDVVELKGFHDPRQVLADCTTPDGTQGISVGFADVYADTLPGQFIDLTADPANPVPPGDYFLVNVANPTGELLEKTMDNNTGVASIRVPSSLDTRAFTGAPPPPPPPAGGHTPRAHTPHAPHAPHTAHLLPHAHAPHRPPHLHVTAHPGVPGQPTT